jgi:hypothetical protein
MRPRSSARSWSSAGAVVAALVVTAAGSARAETNGALWLRQRGSAEWVVGAASFRSSLGADPRVPGFDTFSGGGELLAGLDFYSGLGIVASGRILAGAQANQPYLEGLGGLALQVRVSDSVRLRIGPAAGRATLDGDATILVGGFLAATIDLFSLGSGRLSTALSVRLDVDAMIGGAHFPDRSMALALGIGLRY